MNVFLSCVPCAWGAFLMAGFALLISLGGLALLAMPLRRAERREHDDTEHQVGGLL